MILLNKGLVDYYSICYLMKLHIFVFRSSYHSYLYRINTEQIIYLQKVLIPQMKNYLVTEFSEIIKLNVT